VTIPILLVFHPDSPGERCEYLYYGYFGSNPTTFQISRDLKISERRVRNLYQDVQLRYSLYSREEAIERLVKIIEDQRFEVETVNGRRKYIFQIREPLLRQYFEEWVDIVKGIADTSFSPTIVIISREVFLNVLNVLTPDAHELIENIKIYNEDPDTRDIELDLDIETCEDDSRVEQDKPAEKETAKKCLLDQFLEKYIDTIAEESAKASLNLAATGLRVLLGLAVQHVTGMAMA